MKIDLEFEGNEREIIKEASKIFAYGMTVICVVVGILLIVQRGHFTSASDFIVSTLLMVAVVNQWIWTS